MFISSDFCFLLINVCFTSRPKRLIKLGRLINVDNLRAYLIRGFKFVLPYQSSELHFLVLKHMLMNIQIHTLALSLHRFHLPSSVCCWYVYVLDDNVSGELIHSVVHVHHLVWWSLSVNLALILKFQGPLCIRVER